MDYKLSTVKSHMLLTQENKLFSTHIVCDTQVDHPTFTYVVIHVPIRVCAHDHEDVCVSKVVESKEM